MTKEKPFMDYTIGARARLQNELEKIDNEINRIEYIGTNDMALKQAIIENRKYILSCLLESYATWTKEGDCLPRYVKLGRFGNKWIKVEIIEEF